MHVWFPAPLRRPRSVTLTSLLAVCALLSALLAAPAAGQESQPEELSSPATDDERFTGLGDKDSSQVAIPDAEISFLVNNRSQAPSAATALVELYGENLDAIKRAVEAVGGTVTGEVPGFLIEGRIPLDRLELVAADPHVERVSSPTEANEDSITQALPENLSALQATIRSTLSLEPWHELGHRGAGQRIGIIDLFGQEELTRAINDGRLPSPAGVFCRRAGTSCSITVPNVGPHGVGVAEIAHNIAPDAQLYLATASTLSDLNAAVDWFISQGVTIINRSQTSEFDGPGDGTGPTAFIIDKAIANGMVWVSAAGNAGGTRFSPGQNWVGQFNDPDGDGVHNWANGTNLMGFRCDFLLGMRWDDWASDVIPTDYDLWIFDELNDPLPEVRAADRQSALSHQPLERPNTNCSGTNDRDYLAIIRRADVQPDGTDIIQILGNFTAMDEWVNAFSATGPGVDSRNPGAISVGATESPIDLILASYSSQGPTFDGRPSIDIAGPSCLPVEDFGDCFIGTSASAPAVTGVLTVLRSAGVFTNAQDADGILASITVDRGPAGIDTLYGHGVLDLPTPAALGARTTLPSCNGLEATIVGTSGNDVLVGTEGRDVIFARQGNDIISGLGGDDVICGGFGDDIIDSGLGDDIVFAGPGLDTVRARAGNDLVNGGHGHDDIEGNVGDDVLFGFTGRDYVKGGLGNDEVRGGAGNDRVVGGDGIDEVYGGNGVDRCPLPHEIAVSCRPPS